MPIMTILAFAVIVLLFCINPVLLMDYMAAFLLILWILPQST